MTAPVAPLLTRRQQLILTAIRDYWTQHGYAPTLREIGQAAGLVSVSSVNYQLGELQRMGWIRKDPRRPRALVVLNPEDGSDT